MLGIGLLCAVDGGTEHENAERVVIEAPHLEHAEEVSILVDDVTPTGCTTSARPMSASCSTTGVFTGRREPTTCA